MRFIRFITSWEEMHLAGIGFELKKIYGRKTLAANVWGTVYATMSTIGPSILSAGLLLLLEFFLMRAGWTLLEERFFIAATSYTFIIATLVAVLFAAPVSRYISDSIFLDREEEICPSAFGVLALSSVLAGLIMLILCIQMRIQDGVPLQFLVAFYFVGVLVTDVYTMMTYASALKHYKALTLSFFLGFLLAVSVYFLCANVFGIDKVTAAYISFACCYFLVLVALVFQCVRAFGIPKDHYFAFLSYFRRYPRLAFAGFAYTLGIYIPTIIYWIFSGMTETISIFQTAPVYDYALFLAIFMNMPMLVIFVVKVETTFYEKYTLYVSALNKGTYDLLEKEREAMGRILRHELFFVYETQFIITIVLICLVSVFFPYLNASPTMLRMFILLSLAIYTVFCMYCTIIVFYYFSDYQSACIGTLVFLVTTIAGAITSAWLNDFYPLPLLIGGLCGWVVSFLLLRKRMEKLDSFLMCMN